MRSGSIIVLPGAADSFTVELKGSGNQTVYIGRKGRLDLAKNEKCLTLPYPEISARHAEIRCGENNWTIIDNGSTNGTTLNGLPISPGREYMLQDKDILGIANYTLIISIASDGSQQTTTAHNLEEEFGQTHLQVALINATILVADLKNFTALMEEYAHDPSIVMHAAGNVFNNLNKEIEKYAGQIEKIAGDAVMAYWSAPGNILENKVTCNKACLTAIKLKEVIQKMSKDENIWPFKNHPLSFDIALATGPVAKGALGKSQGNPALLGDTANLAFRLEKLIEGDQSGKIIVEQNTYELVRENFKFKFVGEFEVKGRHNTINCYQLIA